MAPKQIPDTYTAAVVTQRGQPNVFKEIKVRDCEPGEVMVRIKMCGLCHTDLHVQIGDWPVKGKLPIVLGHEGVGEVAAMGSGVTNLKIGDRVCLPWLREACGNCRECITGWETCCPFVKNAGFTADGSFAQYAYAPAKYLGKIPSNVSDEQAAPITCAGVTTYKALKESKVGPGRFVVITGAGGGLGVCCVELALYFGMRVVAIEYGEEKCAHVRKLGAEIVIDAKTCTNVPEKILKETSGGADGAILLVPKREHMPEAVHYVRALGTIVTVALPPGSWELPCLESTVKCQRIVGSLVGTRADLAEVFEIAALGKLNIKVAVHPFKEINECIEKLTKGEVTGRVVLRMD